VKLFDIIPENGRAIGVSMLLFGLALPFSTTVGTIKAMDAAGLLPIMVMLFIIGGGALVFARPSGPVKRLCILPWLLYPLVSIFLALFQAAAATPAALVLYFSLFFFSYREML